MRRGATREDIIRTTQALIIRNGIRAVRVDEIAQRLGISKRTLYETFTDKTALVHACLEEFHDQQRRRIASHMRRCSFMPLQKVFWLTNLFIDNLRRADSCFLADFENKLVCADYFDEEMRFWMETLTGSLQCSQKAGYTLEDVDCGKIAGQLLSTLYKLRQAESTDSEQQLFCRTILRGISTQKGICWIDAR